MNVVTLSDVSKSYGKHVAVSGLSLAVPQQSMYGFIGPDGQSAVRYHSQTPSYTSLANWLRGVINAEIKRVRAEELGLSPESTASLSLQTQV